ncbi:MAG: helix-turn-helix transcriptional regulator [Oscillospiraceae bacterium]|nr:helix-turn-helix transcriptional regulator [Oscillospiraceae bacterium]
MEHQTIGKLIHTLRKEKGLTQKQLGDMLNITDKAISKWERDIAHPDTATLPKLANILGVSVESLLNAKIDNLPKNTEQASTDFNPTWQKHKERSKQLIRQGIPGFIIGSVGILIIFIVYFFQAPSRLTIVDIIGIPIFMIFVGLLVGGFPYGWRLLARLTNEWTIYGNILILIFLSLFKFGISILLGITAYPVAIIYNLIRSQKSQKCVYVGLILFGLAIIVYIILNIMSVAR